MLSGLILGKFELYSYNGILICEWGPLEKRAFIIGLFSLISKKNLCSSTFRMSTWCNAESSQKRRRTSVFIEHKNRRLCNSGLCCMRSWATTGVSDDSYQDFVPVRSKWVQMLLWYILASLKMLSRTKWNITPIPFLINFQPYLQAGLYSMHSNQIAQKSQHWIWYGRVSRSSSSLSFCVPLPNMENRFHSEWTTQSQDFVLSAPRRNLPLRLLHLWACR